MGWRDPWSAETPAFVSERHAILHDRQIARNIVALAGGPDERILDHGFGEALSADRVARACRHLYLCRGAPARLRARYGDEPAITVLSPGELGSIEEESLDLVVVNSLLQHLSGEEFEVLLGVWRSKLRDGGRLVLADVIPPDAGRLQDASALLRFAWRGGFLVDALRSLARTALSDLRTPRDELGPTHYSEPELLALLRERGFEASRLPGNLGPDPHRMTFVATVL